MIARRTPKIRVYPAGLPGGALIGSGNPEAMCARMQSASAKIRSFCASVAGARLLRPEAGNDRLLLRFEGR